ncbi:unnamed protein product [Amoebophrya sp. A120]|nr:unnamed protein product [Amoebophrya sp. A120]|eukprot:GSA120T00002189001.1
MSGFPPPGAGGWPGMRPPMMGPPGMMNMNPMMMNMNMMNGMPPQGNAMLNPQQQMQQMQMMMQLQMQQMQRNAVPGGAAFGGKMPGRVGDMAHALASSTAKSKAPAMHTMRNFGASGQAVYENKPPHVLRDQHQSSNPEINGNPADHPEVELNNGTTTVPPGATPVPPGLSGVPPNFHQAGVDASNLGSAIVPKSGSISSSAGDATSKTAAYSSPPTTAAAVPTTASTVPPLSGTKGPGPEGDNIISSSPKDKKVTPDPIVIVSRIPQDLPDESLRAIFGCCGRIVKWDRQTDPVTNVPAKFAFCHFGNIREVNAVMTFLNGDVEKEGLPAMKILNQSLMLKVSAEMQADLEEFRAEERTKFREANPNLCQKTRVKEGSDGSDIEMIPMADDEVDSLLASEMDTVRTALLENIAAADREYEQFLQTVTPEQRKERERKIQEQERALEERKRKLEDEKRRADDLARIRKELAESKGKRDEAAKKDKEKEPEERDPVKKPENRRPHRKERDREERIAEEERRQRREDDTAVRNFERREQEKLQEFRDELKRLQVTESSSGTVTRIADADMRMSDRRAELLAKDQVRTDLYLARAPRPRRSRRRAFPGLEARMKQHMKRELDEDEEDLEKERQENAEREKEAIRKEQLELEQRLKADEERKTREAVERLTGTSDLRRRRRSPSGDRRGRRRHSRERSNRRGDRDEPSRARPQKDLQALIQTIPEGDAVFDYPINWGIIDKNELLELKVKPWITKKVKELYDKEEASVIDYIYSVVQKVKTQKMTTDDMLAELDKFLDDETQKFCIKLWRCIILYTLHYIDDSQGD